MVKISQKAKRAFLFVTLLVLAFAFIQVYELFVPSFDEDTSVPGMATFTAQDLDFEHIQGNSYPFSGASVIDVDQDGSFEVFIGGSDGQDDALLQFSHLRIDDKTTVSTRNVISESGLSSKEATFGSVAIDFDDDSDTDLIVARESGVYLYSNNQGTFSAQKLEVFLEPHAIPVDVAVADINRDNLPDLYISTFINQDSFKSLTFNDPNHRTQNKLLLGKGNNSFEDISSNALVDQNTFTASFVDLNNDGWQDLVVSLNTDKARAFLNLQNLSFEEIFLPSEYGTWMGIGLADFDNDEDTDILFSNMGHIAPTSLLRGDLREDQVLNPEWLLLENTLERTNNSAPLFSDITTSQNLKNKEFSWGPVFTDFNSDGLQDLVVAENYIKWPVHKVFKAPGRFFTQSDQGVFVSTTRSSGLVNLNFGFAPVVLDANLDGLPDVLIVNIDGPTKLFINENTKDNNPHGVKVVMPDTLQALGARVTAQYQNNTITQHYNPKQGIMSDQSPEIFLGFADYEGPVTLTITLLDGTVVATQEVSTDTTVRFSR